MSDQQGGVRIDCPNPDQWLAVAAGTEDPAVAAQFCAHAANCERCGPQLREAVQLLSDEEDLAESQFIASLDSSLPVWQTNVAARLASKRRELPIRLSSRHPQLRIAIAAAAVIAAAAIGLVLFLLPRNRVSPGPHVVAVLGGRSVSPSPPPDTSQIRSITLEPGLTRGLDSLKEIRLSPEDKMISVTLMFVDSPLGDLHLDMLNSRRQSVWNRDLRMTDQDVHAGRLTVIIPAKEMKRDDYQFEVREVTQGVARTIAYSFRLIR